MKNLKSKLKNFGLGLGIAGLSFLPMKALGQETNINTKGNIHLGLSLVDFNSRDAASEIGVFPGLKIDYSKEIFNEVRGRIMISYQGSNERGDPYGIFLFDIGPQIEWLPTIRNSNPLYFGIGLKYRTLNSTNKKSKEEESFSGIGFGINFGSEIQIDTKGRAV